MRITFYSTFLFVFFWTQLYSQVTPKLKWEKDFGGTRNDEFHAIIENNRGGVTAVGYTRSKANRGSDILLQVLNSNGEAIYPLHNLGGKGDEKAFDICSTFDGGYLIAGFTESEWPESIGGKDGWLVKTDGRGKFLWDQVVGSLENDELNKVLQLSDGTSLSAGQKDGLPYVLKTKVNGKKEWENIFGEKNARVTGLEVSADGFILISGYHPEKKGDQPFLFFIDELGNKIIKEKTWVDWKEGIGEKTNLKSIKFLRPQDLKLSGEGNIVMTGTAGVIGKREDMFFLKLNEAGEVMAFELYGGEREDGCLATTPLFDGNWCLTGFNSSDAGRGERRTKSWANFAQNNGKKISLDEELLFGNVLNNEANDVLQLSNGDLVIAGYTTKVVEKDAHLIYLEYGLPQQLKDNLDLSINPQEIQWVDENGDGMLSANERGYFMVEVTNNSVLPVYNLKAKIEAIATGGITFPKELTIGRIPPRSAIYFSIPVQAEKQVESKLNSFELRLFTPEQTLPSSFTLQVKSQAEKAPMLSLRNYEWVKNDSTADFTVRVDLTNRGTASAQAVACKISLPDYVEIQNEIVHDLKKMEPGQSQSMEFTFRPNSLFQADSIRLEIKAWEETRQHGVVGKFEIPFELISGIRTKSFGEPPSSTDPPPAEPTATLQGVDLLWMAPNPRRQGYDIVLKNKNTFKLELEMNSAISLNEENFELLINGEKDSPTILSVEATPGAEQGSYFFNATIELTSVAQSIQLKIEKDGLFQFSKELKLSRALNKGNLHVYAFGVPHDDLEFTAKDARDFANQFKEQSGQDKIYEETFVHIHATKDSTTAQAIRDAIGEIRYAYEYEETIKKDDTIILFFSTHGRTDESDQSFWIAGSDIDFRKMDARSLHFQFEVMQRLAYIPARKLVILDACHSGSAISNFDELAEVNSKSGGENSQSLSKAIVDLADASKQYYMMSSCKEGQLSYEDPNGENGIFTRALLEAFSNKKVSGSFGEISADEEPSDGVLYLQELFYFAKERIPILLKDKKVKQEPFVSKALKADPLPLFVY